MKMRNTQNNSDSKTRILKKVRKQFLTKSSDEDQSELIVGPKSFCMSGSEIYAIKASVGLVESGRKICIGPQYLNIHFSIKDCLIQNPVNSKAVTLKVNINENNPPIPWEYTVKRLESYGDLQLATWAHRIKNHYTKYSKVMSSYYDLLESNSPAFNETYRITQEKAAIACKEIESNYAYNKIVQFLKKDTNELISSSYSEGFLEKIGHSPESFISWAKENGLPKIMEQDNSMYENIIKEFLSCIPMIADPIQEGVESESVIYHKDGHKIKTVARCVTVLDPTPEGTFYYFYLILKDAKLDHIEKFENEEEKCLEIFQKKMIKNDGELENGENMEGLS